MVYSLPKSVEIAGERCEIRYDYRVILEIFEALNDPGLDDEERAFAVLQMFYVDFDSIQNYDEAISKMFWFINAGKEEDPKKKSPRLVDWNQDYPLVVSPINHILGYEIRGVEYDPEKNTGGVHWWTILSAYMEIGDCLFAQVVKIREKKAKGKPLDRSDKEFYRQNRDLVDFKNRYTDADKALEQMWTSGKHLT